MQSTNRAPHPATLSHADRRAAPAARSAPARDSAASGRATTATAKASANSATSPSGASFDDTLRAVIDSVATIGAGLRNKSASAMYMALKEAGVGPYLGAQGNIAALFDARRAASALGVGVASDGRNRGSAVFSLAESPSARAIDGDAQVFIALTDERAAACAKQFVAHKSPSVATRVERLYASPTSMRAATELLAAAGLAPPPWASTPTRLHGWARLMTAIQAAQ